MTQQSHGEGPEPTEAIRIPELMGDDIPTNDYLGRIQGMAYPESGRQVDPELKSAAFAMLKAITNAALERQLREGAHGGTIDVSQDDIRSGLVTLTGTNEDSYIAHLDAAYQRGEMTLIEIKAAEELADSIRTIDEIYTEKFYGEMPAQS